MSIFERFGAAWNALIAVRRATGADKSDYKPVRIGSSPAQIDLDMQVQSATYQFFLNYTHLEPDRLSVYDDMDEMFQYVLAMGGLEAYIEDATQPDVRLGKSMWVEAMNPRVQAELEAMFANIELEKRLYGDYYSLGKYGDYFTLVNMDLDHGIFDLIPVEPRAVQVKQDLNRVITGYQVGDPSAAEAHSDQGGIEYKPWDIVHWKVLHRRPTDPYGTPFFMQVRLVYKLLKLMEEQMTLYRMNMHPDRLVFKVFVGNSPPEEQRRIVQMWRREIESLHSVNHELQRFVSEWGPWCLTGDTQIALLNGQNVPIQELAEGKHGDEYWVYAYDTDSQRLVPGRGHSAALVARDAELVAVTLDNGEIMRCTAQHEFLLRDGKTYKIAKDLQPGDSLMPRSPGNHKVVSVTPAGHGDVYCLTVDQYHNFALSAGVITHNSVNNSIYWPVGAEDQRSGVEKFAGSSNAMEIMDVEYLRNLFFAGIRVPKAYMGLEDSQGYRGDTTLSQQDIKFARGVRRLQRFVLDGYEHVCKIHLSLRGIDPHNPTNLFQLKSTPPSHLDEAQRAELYSKRFEAVKFLMDVGREMATDLGINVHVWGQYVLREFGGLNDAMIAKLMAKDPKGDDGADIEFAPGNPIMQFSPGEALTEEQTRAIVDTIAAHRDEPMIREALETIERCDLSNPTSYSTGPQSFHRQPLPESGTSASVELSRALTLSEKVKTKTDEARKAKILRMQTELRELVKSQIAVVRSNMTEEQKVADDEVPI